MSLRPGDGPVLWRGGAQLGGVDPLHAYVRAVHPARGLDQGLGHGRDGLRAVQSDLLGHQGAALACGVDAADQPASREHRHREVAVDPLGLGDVGLQAVGEAEDALCAGPLPDQGVERGQECRAVTAARGCLQGRRVGPGGLAPALDRDRDQARVGDHRVDLLALEAVVVGDVRAGADAQGLARQGDQAAEALRVIQLVVQQRLRDRALGEVVHPLPAAALHAHHLAVHEGALYGDFRAGPVPPLAGALGAAQLRRGERAFGAELLDDLVVGAVGEVVVPVRAASVGAAAEREVGPLLHGEDARGVGPVLEGVRLGPVRVLDRPAGDRAEAGVRDQFVGAGEDRDGVELDRAEMAEHAAHARAAVGGAEETLGAQGDAAGVGCRQVGRGARGTRHVSAR